MITGTLSGQALMNEYPAMDNRWSDGIVFKGFPMNQEDYSADMQHLMEEIIEKHGREEWRLAVITSELHGHLGIYAIIGAKMGLEAKALLQAGHDEISIISYAGNKPPVSCLNDGLQVSTGATLGHGLIRISNDPDINPSALFEANGKKILMALKDEISHQIREEIRLSIRKNNGLTEGYWEDIRKLGIRYWLELDRENIFETQFIK